MMRISRTTKRQALDAQTKAKNYTAMILAAERTLQQHCRDCGFQSVLITPDSVICTTEGAAALHHISIPFDPDSDMTPAERAAENDGRGWDMLDPPREVM